jgi:hypothetical protein
MTRATLVVGEGEGDGGVEEEVDEDDDVEEEEEGECEVEVEDDEGEEEEVEGEDDTGREFATEARGAAAVGESCCTSGTRTTVRGRRATPSTERRESTPIETRGAKQQQRGTDAANGSDRNRNILPARKEDSNKSKKQGTATPQRVRKKISMRISMHEN